MAVFIAVLVLASLLYASYIRNKKNCPPMLSDVIKGSPYGLVTTGERTVTQEEMVEGIPLPDPKLGNRIPALTGGSKKFSFYMWVKPENQTDNFQNDNDSLQHLIEWGQNLYIMYEPVRNELVIKVHVLVPPPSDKSQQEFRLTNCIGIQKWNMLGFAFDNRYLDVYVNGRLYRSILMANVPIFDDDNSWLLCRERGFIGKIGAIRYFNYTLSDNEIARLYNNTNGNPPTNGSWWLWNRTPLLKLLTRT